MIIDNELLRRLIDALPVGAHLTAIFDSCHSGTMLDLDRYLCNNIYFPWTIPGFRRYRTLWQRVRRRDGQRECLFCLRSRSRACGGSAPRCGMRGSRFRVNGGYMLTILRCAGQM